MPEPSHWGRVHTVWIDVQPATSLWWSASPILKRERDSGYPQRPKLECLHGYFLPRMTVWYNKDGLEC